MAAGTTNIKLNNKRKSNFHVGKIYHISTMIFIKWIGWNILQIFTFMLTHFSVTACVCVCVLGIFFSTYHNNTILMNVIRFLRTHDTHAHTFNSFNTFIRLCDSYPLGLSFWGQISDQFPSFKNSSTKYIRKHQSNVICVSGLLFLHLQIWLT